MSPSPACRPKSNVVHVQILPRVTDSSHKINDNNNKNCVRLIDCGWLNYILRRCKPVATMSLTSLYLKCQLYIKTQVDSEGHCFMFFQVK